MEKELKIGQRIQAGFVTIECRKAGEEECIGCFGYERGCLTFDEMFGACVASERRDKEDVIFVIIDNP